MKIFTTKKDKKDLFRYAAIRLQQAKKDEEFFLIGHTTFRRLQEGAKLLRNEQEELMAARELLATYIRWVMKGDHYVGDLITYAAEAYRLVNLYIN